MVRRKNIYIQRSIVRRWKAEVGRAGNECSAFSPYLTSPIADTVLLAAESKDNCRVYTLFDAEVFLSGASSIRTLRRLQNAGISLYAIRDLHAKIVIVSPYFASIGSQNITAGGAKRREATVIITDRKAVEQIWSEVKPWCGDAQEITNEMIDEMIRLLPPLKKKMKDVQSAAEAVNQEIERREQERAKQRRESEERRKAEVEQRRRIAELRDFTTKIWLNEVSKARLTIRATVASESRPSGGLRYVLRRTRPIDDLTSWRLQSGGTVSFQRLNCYLCMIHSTWKVGFARVAQTRITFIGKAIRWPHSFTIGGENCKVVFVADWSGADTPNLTCDVEPLRMGGTAKMLGWFRLTGLEIQEVTFANDRAGQLEEWSKSNRDRIRNDLLQVLLKSFSYEHPTSANEANSFFGPVGTRYVLRAGQVNKCPLLIAIRR